jgi:hypothetical protein
MLKKKKKKICKAARFVDGGSMGQGVKHTYCET